MTVQERLSSVPTSLGNTRPSEVDYKTWREWEASYSNGDPVSIARRIEQLPNSQSLVRAFTSSPPPQFTKPRWFGIAESLLDNWSGKAIQICGEPFPKTSAFAEEKILPFQELFRGAIALARSLLRLKLVQLHESALDEFGIQWSAQAYLRLERQLLQTLVGVSSQMLYAEFTESSGLFGVRVLGLLGHQVAGNGGDANYNRFISTLMSGGIQELLQKYPVLICLLAKKILFWVEATAELITRFSVDRSRIAATLKLDPNSVVCVSDVKTGLSDPHLGGRSVGILVFPTGERVVYKPRSLQVDVVYQRFIEWFNSQGGIQLRPLRIVDSGDYGFVEHVKHSPCQDKQEVHRFYQRIGALLAIAHQLRLSDLHHENVIACGEFPVLIDVETAFSPNQASDFHSILQTGLLPQYRVDRRNNVEFDIGGLTGGGPVNGTAKRWINVNSDGMCEVLQTVKLKESENVPVIDGERVVPSGYATEIIDGYKVSAMLLHEQNAKKTRDTNPFEDLARCQSRAIKRDTNTYLMKLEHQLHPSSLRSGIKYTIVIDELFRTALASGCEDNTLRCIEEETRSLADLDVPLFTVESVSPGPLCTDQSPLQIRIIEETLLEKHLPSPIFPDGDCCSSYLIDQAVRIADEVLERSIETPQGVLWLENFRTGLSDHDYAAKKDALNRCLYDGSTGTSILLGAAYKQTKEDKFREAAIRCISPLMNNRNYKRSGLGAGLGLGGQIYAITLLADMLGEDALLGVATDQALGVSREEIDTDLDLDVMSGIAGLGLGILKLYSQTNDSRILDVAIRCGNRLLNTEKGGAWQSKIEQTALTGFSHGAAGCTAFLSRLSRHTSGNDLNNAIMRALRWENGHFSTKHQNWADLRKIYRKSSKPRYNVNMWCNGATGVGLARLSALPLPQFHETALFDIRRTVDSLKNASPCSLDHLCCGEFGRLDCLLTVACATDCLATHQQIDSYLERILTRVKRSGWRLRVGEQKTSAFSPALFTGIAGIGYTLFRLASPNIFPSIINFE
ncbi:MAG: type 2 lanthipeptide synthetase LanM [Pirellula sp.]